MALNTSVKLEAAGEFDLFFIICYISVCRNN